MKNKDLLKVNVPFLIPDTVMSHYWFVFKNHLFYVHVCMFESIYVYHVSARACTPAKCVRAPGMGDVVKHLM